MKKAPFLFSTTIVIMLFCLGCKQNKKANVASLQWTSNDELRQLHPYFDSLHQAVIVGDTNLVNKHFLFCYDSLDILTEDSATLEKTLSYYDNFYNILAKATKYQDYFLTKKSRLLQYIIYINTKTSNSNKVIKYYNILNTKEYEPFLSETQKLPVLLKVGVAYNKTGDLAKTEETYKQALALANKLEDKNRAAQCLINLNIVLLEKEAYDTIINNMVPLLQEAIKPEYKSKLAGNIADAYFEKNDIKTALTFVQKAEKYLENIDSADLPLDYDIRIGVVYHTYARIYAAQKNIPNADKYFNLTQTQFAAAYDNTGRELGKIYLEMADYKKLNPSATLANNELAYINKAIRCIDPSFDMNDSMASPNEAAITDENLYFEAMDAKAAYAINSTNISNTISGLEKIDQYYKTAFIAEKKLLNNFVYDSSKMAFLEYSKERTKLAVENCLKAFSLTKDIKWQEKAFQYIENNKAAVLLEQLKKNKILQSSLAADADVKQLDSIKRELVLANNEDSARLLTAKEQVEQLLRNKYPQLSEQNQFGQVWSLKNIQETLNKRSLLMNYFYVGDSLYYIYITKNDIRFARNTLSQDKIVKYKLDCANLEIQQKNPNAFFGSAYTLGDALGLAQVEDKITELIIMPSEVLNNFSFESLLTKQYTTLSQIKFFVDKYCISYCYSYATLLQKNDYNNTDLNILVCTPASTKALNSQPVLNFSKNEAAEIKKEFGNALHLDNSEATTNNFLKQYNNYKIIHLATHSISDTVTGNSRIDFYDGAVVAQQLQQNNTLKTELFFLSACETSLGKQTINEGVLSLARSLYSAGAKNIVASQWAINDATTATIVAQFYKNIRTAKYAKALQGAKTTYLKNAAVEKKLPYYWASLHTIGYQIQYKTNNYYWLALLGLILFATATVFLLKRKYKKLGKLRKINFFKKKS